MNLKYYKYLPHTSVPSFFKLSSLHQYRSNLTKMIATCFRSPVPLFLSLGLCSPVAQALDFNWSYDGEGNWFDSGNWDTSGNPTSGNGVLINNGGTAVIREGETASAGIISLGNGSGNEGHLIIRNSGSLSGTSINIGNGGSSSLLIDGGTLTTASEPHMSIGTSGGAGVVTISNNGRMTIGSQINVGSSGQGTLILNSGLVHAVWSMRIGENAGSVGLVTVNGGEITNGMDNNFVVGRGGNGTLEINNDGKVSSDWAFLGGEVYRGSLVAQGTGTVTMTGNSLFDNYSGIVMSAGGSSISQATLNGNSIMTTNGSFYLSYDGFAELTVNHHGTLNSNSALLIGMNGGSRGYLTLNDNATVTASYLYAGYDGYGEVKLNDGSISTPNSIYIGRNAAGNGLIAVNDGQLTTSASLYVGHTGRGTLTINGGLVSAAGAVWIGTAAGSNGVLNLNGGVLETNQLSGYSGSALMSFDGGTVRALSDNVTFIKDVGTITVGDHGATIDSNGKTIGITSSFASAGSDATLTKAGAGTLTLGADNSGFSGELIVDQGTLNLAVANNLQNATSVKLNGTSTLDTLNTNQTLQTLSGDSGSSLLSGTGNLHLINHAGRDSVFAGRITGSGLLTKTGAGKLTLSGTGSTQNEVDVQQGTLSFSQNGTFNVADGYITRTDAITDIGRGNSQLVSWRQLYTGGGLQSGCYNWCCPRHCG